jgi:hypothetical protein
MLKKGDWVETLFQVKNITNKIETKNKKHMWIGFDTRDYAFAVNEDEFRILTPEEVKAKGLDEKSNFEPQEPNDGVKTVSQSRNRKPKQPYTKFLFCEDGSVDTDSLEKDLRKHNPEIKVVVYRQGANAPQLVDIKETK